MGSERKMNIAGSDHLRHVESMKELPSGAGKIPRLNAVVLGEALASEEDDLVVPSEDFSRQALVSSPQQVIFLEKIEVLFAFSLLRKTKLEFLLVFVHVDRLFSIIV